MKLALAILIYNQVLVAHAAEDVLETSDVFDEASVELSGTEGLELEELKDGKLRLKGEVHRASDEDKIRKLLQKYPAIENKTKFTKAARAHLASEIRRRLKEISPLLELKENGAEFLILGSISSSDLEKLRQYYSQIRVAGENRGTRTSHFEPSILLEMALVEVKKSALQKLGVRLSNSISAGTNFNFKFLPEPEGQLGIRNLDPIRSFLDMALQSGEAKIHAKESIVTENRKEGQFQAGGEFPIRITGAHSTKIEYKNFGIFLKFTPILETPPMVHLVVHSEISEIDMGSLVDGLPMITKKELKTQVYAKLDQMMALGGVVRSSASKFSEDVPGLSEIPVLGRLFRSEDFKRHKSEAYLFITAKKMEGPWLPSPDL